MTIRRAERVFSRRAPGFLVIADGDGVLTEISGSGGDVWECLAQPIEESALVDALAARHGVDAAVVSGDVMPLVSGLIERGLVVRDG